MKPLDTFCIGAWDLTYLNIKSYCQLPFIFKLQPCMLPDKRCLSHGMCLYQVMMTWHFLNGVANDSEWTQKNQSLRHIHELKSESTW